MFSKFFSHVQLASLAAVGIAATAVLAGVAGVPVRAGLIAYEPFNYPSLANGSNFCPTSTNGAVTTGATSNALGFTGAYTLGDPNFGSPGPVSVTYDTTGPGFVGLQTGGGAVTINGDGTAHGSAALSVEFGGTMTGNTLYGGYLVETTSVQSNYSAGIFIGAQNAGQWFSSNQVDSSALNNQGTATAGNNMGAIDAAHISGTGAGSAATSNTGTAVGIGTYLDLFKVTGVNASSGPVSMQDWVLTDSQYQHFLANGGITSANLNSAATGTGSSNVLQVGSFTDSAPAAWPQFNSGSYITYWTYLGFPTTLDEMRLSDGRLADVAPVPEPATLGLMAIGGLGLLLLKLRRTA